MCVGGGWELDFSYWFLSSFCLLLSGIFGLLQVIAFAEYLRRKLQADQMRYILTSMVIILGLIGFVSLVLLTFTGHIAPWTGRFYSLFDPEYAKIHIPIITSVSEHQPTPWTSFFFDMQSLMFLFPLGLYFCFQELADEHVFLIVYALTASYFAGVMVRLILTFAPVVCMAAAIGFSHVLDVYLKDLPPALASATKGDRKRPRKLEAHLSSEHLRVLVLAPLLMVAFIYQLHCTYATSYAYSSPSVVLTSTSQDGSYHIIDDFREAYYWLRKNTPLDAKIMSWWDYGYQIAGFSNRTTLVDNNTWNNSHIATVGRAMASNEEDAYEIMRKLDVDYVLVIFGSMVGFSGDDINKFLWMVRIGQGVYPQHIKEPEYLSNRGEYRLDNEASQTMLNCLMYKLSYYRFYETQGTDHPFDRVRGTHIGRGNFHLNYVEEAFTSEHWIVRLYKVKNPDILGRDLKRSSLYDRTIKKKFNTGHSTNIQVVLPKGPQLHAINF
jgi:dolichyl-diphosphooligosaccharide---protein glycosyltransferase